MSGNGIWTGSSSISRRGLLRGSGALALGGMLPLLGGCRDEDGRTDLRFFENKRETSISVRSRPILPARRANSMCCSKPAPT